MSDMRFLYDGFVRHVSNVTVEWDTFSLIGFEVRKSGKWSYKIKRYSLEKIDNLEIIDRIPRSGAKIGVPN